jgi:hypothetical protein
VNVPGRTRRTADAAEASTPVELTDVADLRQLQSYAATGQVAFMDSGRAPDGRRWSQNELALQWRRFRTATRRTRAKRAADEATPGSVSSNFSRSLRNPSLDFLQDLDAVLLRQVPELKRAGGLSAFAARITGRRVAGNFGFEVDSLNRPLILELTSPPPIIVLEQAAILLAEFEESAGDAAGVLSTHRETFPRVVEQLIRIGGLPPTPYSVDALLLLGELSRYAFGTVQEHLDRALRTPLGFRVWRAVTAVVVAIKQHREQLDPRFQPVRDWVRIQLEVSGQLRDDSLYPARSLELELAIEVPFEWSGPGVPGRDWASELLWDRARDRGATLRERGTASFGLWERACAGGYSEDVRPHLLDLIEEYRREGRPGLGWVAETLRTNVDAGRHILTAWEGLHEPCQVILDDAGRYLTDVPPRIRAATHILLQHAVIKNAGVYRRRAIDTLRAGAWGGQVLPALEAVLDHPQAEPWLRCRALFAIGFLQDRGPSAVSILHRACDAAWRRAVDAEGRAELHAALFAVGDCFGTPDGATAAGQIRERLDPCLAEILEAVVTGEDFVPVGRALAYLLATTAHGRPAETWILLDRLAEVDDGPTRQMCRWGRQRLQHPLPAHEVQF